MEGYQAYTGDEQDGHFIALHVVPEEDAVITGELIGGAHGPVTLDSDNVIIFRITSTSQKIKFTQTVDGVTCNYVYTLHELVLAEAA